jgi:hypothetical protein
MNADKRRRETAIKTFGLGAIIFNQAFICVDLRLISFSALIRG